jgi:hypothetical protein
MKAKQIFNAIFFVNLISIIVIGVQAFTGYFIEPAVQIAVLTMLNLVFRFTTGTISAPVGKAPAGVNPKVWYQSKMIWVSLLSLFGGIIQSATGWAIPADMYLQIIAGIAFVISIVTHKPCVIV